MNSKISRWQGAGLVATTLLGTGVFILPELILNSSGGDSVAVWSLLTLMIIPVAFVIGKLAADYPLAGGPTHYVEKAFGAKLGRSLGLLFICVVPFGAPAAVLPSGFIWSVGVQMIYAMCCFLIIFAELEVHQRHAAMMERLHD